MGTVDTMMVSNVGSAAISAVSLVDSINILVIQALSALAAGGAILCSQYIGSEKRDGAIRSAQQVLFVMTVLSVALSAGCLIFRVPLLRVIFGAVEADVMKNSQVYFLFTLLSFPFIGLYDAGASILRAQNNSRSPMVISVISNFMNIGGNAILIFGFHMGVEGAAISTLISRIFCAVVVLWKLRDESKPIFVKQAGLWFDQENTVHRYSIGNREQYVPVWKAGDSVHCVHTWHGRHCRAGDDEHP